MNRVLARQLRRLGLDPDAPPDLEAWQALLQRVGRSYDDADRTRYLMERSLHISEQEMEELHRRMRSMSEARLERSESHYRNLFTQSPIAIWEEDFTRVGEWLAGLRAAGVADLQAYLDERPDELRRAVGLIEVRDVNAAAVVLMRTPDKAPLLGPVALPIPDDDPAVYESFRREFQAVWDGAARATFEFSGNRFDGSQLYGIFNWSAPRINGHLDLSRVAVAIVDITERKETEDRMEALVRSKDEFLASVSHELRTPLTTVYASAESLLDQSDALEPELERELIGYIAKESAELSNMVEDLLVAARAEIGTVKVAPRQVDLRPIAEAVVGVVRLDDPGRDIGYDEVWGSVWADPLRLKQILRNLVTNAMRYGGPHIRLQVEAIGSRTVITVLDDGDGVAAEHRESIFRLYETVHDSPGRVGSVGIGLAVARQLADLMGGRLDYEYAGGWSRFRLTLPSAAPGAGHGGEGTVTYVDFSRNAS